MDKIGLYSFTGCAGELLTILHSEDELLDFFGCAEVKFFLMAQSNNEEVNLDIALVEGSITTDEQTEKLRGLRARSKTLVAMGICACFGGIQAMRRGDGGWEKRFKKVYGEALLEVGKPFESQPLDALVKVDHYIPGCPMDKGQFFSALTRLLNGNPPSLYKFPVCNECKWRGNECLLLKNIPCLGPLTAGGCNAICPSYNLPCVGCWGPVEEANVASEYQLLQEKGFSGDVVTRRMKTFGGVRMAQLIKDMKKV